MAKIYYLNQKTRTTTGTSLRKKSTQKQKLIPSSLTQEISRRIIESVATGMTVKDAFDDVLGAGSFETLASDLYDALRSN